MRYVASSDRPGNVFRESRYLLLYAITKNRTLIKFCQRDPNAEHEFSSFAYLIKESINLNQKENSLWKWRIDSRAAV